MSYKITILGCGNSTGIPAIGNYWGKCDPSEPKNRRTRSSILVESGNTKIVVDTGPDFREQLNRANVSMIDAVLYTHAHADHMNGIDDLRVLVQRGQKMIPVYSNAETIQDLKGYFTYMFDGGKTELYPPLLSAHVLTGFGTEHSIGDIKFIPFEQDHETCISVGYRFGTLGYSVDARRLDDKAVNALKGVETWIVDSAGYKSEDPTVHANLETIYALNERIGARQVYLSSLTLGMDYQTLVKELRPGYLPAHDGLILTASAAVRGNRD
jgi:phosphoribosyl 1,2-cyclic phosphate phosphodiesterase